MNTKQTLKVRLLTVLIITASCTSLLQAQSLYVLKKDVTQDSFETMNIRSLSFSNDRLVINQKDGNSVSVERNNTQHLSFTDYSNTELSLMEKMNTSDTNTLICYPNPTSSELNIEMSDTEGQAYIEVSSTAGQLILSKNKTYTKSLFSLDTSSLKPGMYILRVNDRNQIRTSSFIKQ